MGLDVIYSEDRNLNPSVPCYEGEILYLKENPDIAEAFKKQMIRSGYFHWTNSGKSESRKYSCNKEPSANSNPTKECPEGEDIYLRWYKDVAAAIPEFFKSGF